MGSHHSAHAQTTTWLTPQPVIEALGPFELDPCAAPSPRPWPTADRHIELPEDGFTADWGKAFVWLNPPYGSAAYRWLEKLADHGNGIALIPARTETKGFVRAVWRRADALLFLPAIECSDCGEPDDRKCSCWVSIESLSLADKKALFAADGTFNIGAGGEVAVG